MDRDDPLLHQLCGKVNALELLMERLLCDFAARAGDDPLVEIKRARLLLFSSLQNLDRSGDESGEAVWKDMTEALDRMFRNATKELEEPSRR